MENTIINIGNPVNFILKELGDLPFGAFFTDKPNAFSFCVFIKLNEIIKEDKKYNCFCINKQSYFYYSPDIKVALVKSISLTDIKLEVC